MTTFHSAFYEGLFTSPLIGFVTQGKRSATLGLQVNNLYVAISNWFEKQK